MDDCKVIVLIKNFCLLVPPPARNMGGEVPSVGSSFLAYCLTRHKYFSTPSHKDNSVEMIGQVATVGGEARLSPQGLGQNFVISAT